MIVSSRDLELILNPRIRQRVIQLPVQHGEFGEQKPCKARRGGVYHLRSRPPYERYKLEAGQQPTQARAVLWLVDRCEEPRKAVTITVISADREAETWTVRFVMGECEVEEKPRLLKAKPGGEHYTSIPSMALRGSGNEVDEDAQAKYATEASEGAREAGNALREERSQRLADALAAIAEFAETPDQLRSFKAAQRTLRTLERKIGDKAA
jgi:hypothetical protein